MKVSTQSPAFLQEHIAKALDVLHDAGALARADIEPDATAGLRARTCRETVNGALVPPDGGRKCGDFSKDAWILQADVEGNEGTKRRAAYSCGAWGFQDPVFILDERHQLL